VACGRCQWKYVKSFIQICGIQLFALFATTATALTCGILGRYKRLLTGTNWRSHTVTTQPPIARFYHTHHLAELSSRCVVCPLLHAPSSTCTFEYAPVSSFLTSVSAEFTSSTGQDHRWRCHCYDWACPCSQYHARLRLRPVR
jgi:hypothetical protein